MNKMISVCVTFGFLMIFITGCHSQSVQNDIYGQQGMDAFEKKNLYPLKIKDANKNEVSIIKEPERIVSLSADVTEIIFALGAGDKIVGRSTYSNYSDQVKNIPTVGTDSAIQIDRIIELAPDLVIASSQIPEDVVNQIKLKGISVLSLDWEKSFKGTYFLMGNIGLVLNRQEEAQSLMIDMENRIKVVEEKIMDQYIPQVLYIEEIDDNGYIFSAGKESWFNTLLELAGGVNLDHKETQTINSIETLHLLDPDYILVPAGEGVMEQLSLLEGYENLRAYQEGKIIPFNEEFLKIQGPRLADGLLELAKIIHPDIVFE